MQLFLYSEIQNFVQEISILYVITVAPKHKAVAQYKRFLYKEVAEVSSVNTESLYIKTHQIFTADYT